MRRVIAVTMVVVWGLVAESSMAQGVQYAEKTEYSFEDDVVTGDLVRPDGELIVKRKKGRERSLIRVREHFIPEMLKSVEDL